VLQQDKTRRHASEPARYVRAGQGSRVAPGSKDPPRQVHNVYIVFSSAQVYPEFLIWYTVNVIGGAE
jgi:hypothetical protein